MSKISNESNKKVENEIDSTITSKKKGRKNMKSRAYQNLMQEIAIILRNEFTFYFMYEYLPYVETITSPFSLTIIKVETLKNKHIGVTFGIKKSEGLDDPENLIECMNDVIRDNITNELIPIWGSKFFNIFFQVTYTGIEVKEAVDAGTEIHVLVETGIIDDGEL